MRKLYEIGGILLNVVVSKQLLGNDHASVTIETPDGSNTYVPVPVPMAQTLLEEIHKRGNHPHDRWPHRVRVTFEVEDTKP